MCVFQGYYNVVFGDCSWTFCLELDFFKQLVAQIWIFSMFLYIECIRKVRLCVCNFLTVLQNSAE